MPSTRRSFLSRLLALPAAVPLLSLISREPKMPDEFEVTMDGVTVPRLLVEGFTYNPQTAVVTVTFRECSEYVNGRWQRIGPEQRREIPRG